MAAGRPNVLMVEDEESITEPLAAALEREGFDTRVAGERRGAALERGAPGSPTWCCWT